MNSLRNRGWSHRVRSRAWAAIGLAAVFAFSFSGTLAAQQKVELKELKLEALGPALFTHNDGLPVRVTAFFSDGSEKNVTKDPNCKFATEGSGLDEEKGKVYVFPRRNEREFTLRTSYDFGGKSERAKLTLRIHDEYAFFPDFHMGSGPTEQLKEARAILEAKGLRIEAIPTREHDCAFDVGRITDSKPARYEVVKKGSTVTLWYNPEPIPSVVGKSEQEAQNILEGKGLKVKVLPAIFYVTNHPPGVVVSQTPAAPVSDKSARTSPALVKGTTVRLVMNGQPIVVPDLIGKTEAEADKILRGMKLRGDVGPSALHDPNHDVGKVVDQSPEKGKKVASGATIRLGLNPAPLPRMGITVNPPKGPYQMQDRLTFFENLDRKGNNVYVYTWYIDGTQVGHDISSVRHRFTAPGPHYVQLVAKCAATGWEDAIIRNIGIEYPPDPELGIWVIPWGPYTNRQPVVFQENCKNVPNDTKYNWYFGFFNEEIGSGKRIKYTLPDKKGTYDVTLGLRFGSDNFDALKKTITITVGDPPIGLMGSHVNRFRVDGMPDNVRISSCYWKGGYTASQGIGPVVTVMPGWSDFVRFHTVGAVDALDFYTGLQAGGHNSGFLVYVPAGRNEIRFVICGFTFGDPGKTPGAFTGCVQYSGVLPLAGHTVIPRTLRWVEQHARCGVAEWQTEQGPICRARIWKTKSSAGMSGSGAFQNVFVQGGVEDLGCEQYDPSTDPGTGTTAAGISTATQVGGQIQAGLSGSTGQTAQAGQAIPGWYIKPGGQPPGGGGTGTGGAGTANLSNVTVSQTNVTVTFWDHGQEDGDIINVYLNGNLLRGNVILTNAKQSFPATLNSGQNNFEIEAVNEGRIPPNTASVNISHVTQGPATQIYERKSGARASMALTAP